MTDSQFALVTLRSAIGLLLIGAAIAKLLQPFDFRTAINSVPALRPATRAIVGVLPVAEFLLGLGLLVSVGREMTTLLVFATILFTSFTLWASWVVATGLHVSCGCFGTSKKPVDLSTALRDALLTAAALVALRLSLDPMNWVHWPFGPRVITGSSAAAAVALVQALRLILPRLIVSLGQLPQVGVSEVGQ